MTRFILLALGLALGACDVIGAGNHPTVANVQASGVRDCAFLPTKETAEKIIKARPMQSSEAIAAQVCAAVKATRRGTVAGVAIEGLTVR